MLVELPPEMATAMAAAYGGIPILDEDLVEFYGAFDEAGTPPIPPPVVEGPEICNEIDPMSGAACMRGSHLKGDLVHWCDDGDFRIEWREPIRLIVSTRE